MKSKRKIYSLNEVMKSFLKEENEQGQIDGITYKWSDIYDTSRPAGEKWDEEEWESFIKAAKNDGLLPADAAAAAQWNWSKVARKFRLTPNPAGAKEFFEKVLVGGFKDSEVSVPGVAYTGSDIEHTYNPQTQADNKTSDDQEEFVPTSGLYTYTTQPGDQALLTRRILIDQSTNKEIKYSRAEWKKSDHKSSPFSDDPQPYSLKIKMEGTLGKFNNRSSWTDSKGRYAFFMKDKMTLSDGNYEAYIKVEPKNVKFLKKK